MSHFQRLHLKKVLSTANSLAFNRNSVCQFQLHTINLSFNIDLVNPVTFNKVAQSCNMTDSLHTTKIAGEKHGYHHHGR
ncbi:hypothetical protein CRX67_14410 [Enterobacteriaceae bacterium A-F18]|uniref:Uncharacterized protein n=1 Tax=Phytobacter diazotrophicus TaxID=395631 RepID=A0ABM7VXJ8_9ENTR|nr:hypothetical protein C2U55_15155 [Enterobacteriaceae bacterium ENNIH3]AUV09595.1 hypothetical protein C2U52_26740 [Enterobacteriaceae bacterium ENNIH2]PTA96460.1 hypothetical protein C9415_06425 [Kluyvera sp. Nf5]PWF51227.1 hypothetical protein BHT19_0009820 [[Kluyvera] intestini]PXW60699.1 hypothetical protein DFO55_102109 [Grimontella sp. AG753]QIH64183.1 hypothetical protein CRX67_14410 [Enterobacteriaceae bacterium A-F18]SLJ95701.1 hypothetical protein SAMN03159434_102428 [Enterobacter